MLGWRPSAIGQELCLISSKLGDSKIEEENSRECRKYNICWRRQYSFGELLSSDEHAYNSQGCVQEAVVMPVDLQPVKLSYYTGFADITEHLI